MNQHYQGAQSGDKHSNGYSNKRPDVKNYSAEIKINVPDFDSKQLLGLDAEKLAKEITSSRKLTTNQIRNFYGEVKNIERILIIKADAWDQLYGRIKLIKAKAVYNNNRSQKALPDEFKEFLCQCIDKITPDESGKKTFTTFCQLFEAVVGYSSPYTRNQ